MATKQELKTCIDAAILARLVRYFAASPSLGLRFIGVQRRPPLAEHNTGRSRDGMQMIRRRGYLGYARMLEQIERCVARARAGKAMV
jgi:hypothetical protein